MILFRASQKNTFIRDMVYFRNSLSKAFSSLKDFSSPSAPITMTRASSLSLTMRTARQMSTNRLNLNNVNSNFRKMEYAVRGPLVIRAAELSAQIKAGTSKKPFGSVISANIGDCHAMNQQPITFIRQVIACASDTKLLSSPDMPNDVKEKVRELLSYCNGNSVGSYSGSCGVEIIRHHVADYIKKRDGGIECDWQNVFLSTGASHGIKMILSLINQSNKPGLPTGVMIPIPQYPLYSASLCEFGMHQVNYYLDEENNWSLNMDELREAYDKDKDKCDLKAICVINPGNPTGSVLSEQNILDILKFAHERKLVVLADEVYQHNVYDENSKFVSFKKVLTEKTNYKLELASFMSASKGYMGECGLRAGFCEITNFDPQVRDILHKSLSAWLCSSILGQFAMDCIVDPPKEGQESYELHEKEKRMILGELKRKAELVVSTFNSIDGVKSNVVAGAMYAFPRLTLPEKAIKEARSLNYAPDFYYALQFLENYGVCVVPGSGFGQRPDSYHFRTTILPPTDVFEDMMERFRKFHAQFSDRFSG